MFHAVIDWPTSWQDCVREDGYGFSVDSCFCLSCDALGNSPLRRQLRRLNTGLKWRSRQDHGAAMIKDKRDFAPERSLGASAENGKNKNVCFLGCLFGGSCWYYLKSDFSESTVSHRSTACFSASPGPSLPGMEDHISKQSDPLSHQANSKKGLPYWCSACWILTVFIHLRVAFRRREGEEASAHA